MTNRAVALYAAVSIFDRGTQLHLDGLRRYAADRRWRVVGEFIDCDAGWRQDRRPALRRLMRAADAGAFTIVLVADLAHFACSGRHVVRALFTFATLGIRFVAANEPIDTESAQGTVMLTLVDAVVRLQREIAYRRVRQMQRRLDHSRRPAVRQHLHLVASSDRAREPSPAVSRAGSES